ncbi:hypothetical protein CQZ98_14955 [Pseudomonas sp. MYb115]|nr:hypothetical protein CQZ98_14955 [Pseudomonas sp. MYb115]
MAFATTQNLWEPACWRWGHQQHSINFIARPINRQKNTRRNQSRAGWGVSQRADIVGPFADLDAQV